MRESEKRVAEGLCVREREIEREGQKESIMRKVMEAKRVSEKSGGKDRKRGIQRLQRERERS